MEKVYYKLIQIKGIGPSLASKICLSLGIASDAAYNSLTISKVDELNLILGYLRKLSAPAPLQLCRGGPSTIMSPIDSLLFQFNKKNILKLIAANTFKGRRHKLGYPVRGQRTRSNAKNAFKLNRLRFA